MIRYKVATICSAMHDVELHDLHDVVHAGSTNQTHARDPIERMEMEGEHAVSLPAFKAHDQTARVAIKQAVCQSRGCWRRVSDSRYVFFPAGVALTEWLPGLTHS